MGTCRPAAVALWGTCAFLLFSSCVWPIILHSCVCVRATVRCAARGVEMTPLWRSRLEMSTPRAAAVVLVLGAHRNTMDWNPRVRPKAYLRRSAAPRIKCLTHTHSRPFLALRLQVTAAPRSSCTRVLPRASDFLLSIYFLSAIYLLIASCPLPAQMIRFESPPDSRAWSLPTNVLNASLPSIFFLASPYIFF
ncbi:hypothetical protein C8R45DRAFT_87193 [Mycena sanguinolenta]|nr:hypothetical protein C8R45DRAFT_87193 [Mycena sanguinolenta]